MNKIELGAIFASIINPIVNATMSGNMTATPAALSKRHTKLNEELGEVSEAYLDIMGSNRKGKTFADLVEEQVDAFIVAADIAVLAGLSKNGVEQAPALRTAMVNNLFAAQVRTERYQDEPMTEFAFEEAIQSLAFRASGAYRLLSAPDYFKAGYAVFDAAATLLLMDAELLADGGSVIAPDVRFSQRLNAITVLVAQKVSKWERNRALPKAA